MQSLPVRFSSCSEKQLEETSAEQMASSPSSVMPQSGEEARRTATADPQSLEVRVVADEAAERGDAGERERVPGDAQRDERVVQRGRVDVTHSARIPGSVMLLSGMSDRNHTNSPEVACGDRGKGYA